MDIETLQVLAKFERSFHLNWYCMDTPNQDEIERVLTNVWQQLKKQAERQAIDLTSESVHKINQAISSQFNTQENSTFRNLVAWNEFLNDTVADRDEYVSKTNISGTEAWFIAILFHDHLEIFRLATAWMFINAINIQSDKPELNLSTTKLSKLKTDLRSAGFPDWDGENLRSHIYKYGIDDTFTV